MMVACNIGVVGVNLKLKLCKQGLRYGAWMLKLLVWIYLCSVEFLNTGKFSLLLLLVLVGYIWLSGNNNYILYGLVFFFCKHECLTNTYTDGINKHYFSYLKNSLWSLLWNELFLDTYFYDA